MNDNEIASKFNTAICILYVFGRITVFIIGIWPNSKDSLFSTTLLCTLDYKQRDCSVLYYLLCLLCVVTKYLQITRKSCG